MAINDAQTTPGMKPTFQDFYDETSPPTSFQTGGRVRLRGESKPNREWTIQRVGDKFYTLVTGDKEGLYPGEEIRVVTADDIFSPDRLPPATAGVGFMPLNGNAVGPVPNPLMGVPPTNNINIRVIQGDDHSKNTESSVSGTKGNNGNNGDNGNNGNNDNNQKDNIAIHKGAIKVTKQE